MLGMSELASQNDDWSGPIDQPGHSRVLGNDPAPTDADPGEWTLVGPRERPCTGQVSTGFGLVSTPAEPECFPVYIKPVGDGDLAHAFLKNGKKRAELLRSNNLLNELLDAGLITQVLEDNKRQQISLLCDSVSVSDRLVDIVAIKKLGDLEVVCDTRRTIQSAIIYNYSMESDLQSLEEALLAGGVNVTAIFRKTRYYDERRVPTEQVIFKFTNTSLPKYIIVHLTRYNMKILKPRPVRCVRCQIFGHISINCKARSVCCGKCGEAHDTINCPVKFAKVYGPDGAILNAEEKARIKCCNCGGNHPAFSKTCPKYKFAKAATAVQHVEKISYAAAARKVKRSPADNLVEGRRNSSAEIFLPMNEICTTLPQTGVAPGSFRANPPETREMGTQSDPMDLMTATEDCLKSLSAEKLVESVFVKVLNFQDGDFIASMLCEIFSSAFRSSGRLMDSPKASIVKSIKKFTSVYTSTERKRKTHSSNDDIATPPTRPDVPLSRPVKQTPKAKKSKR